MKTLRLTLTCILLTFIAALPAMAGPRTFVSGLGNDANPGTREQPKRTFASALSVTDPGGEIVALDSAGFGSSTLTINKSISIIAPVGVYAGVRVSSGDAITVNAGASDTVVLRGLTITSGGESTGRGINFTAGRTLHVERCICTGFAKDSSSMGIQVNGGSSLFVSDSTFRGNFYGMRLQTGKASLDHVRLVANLHTGLYMSGSGTLVTVTNSVASGNSSGQGMFANQGSQLNAEFCQAANNGNGIESYDPGTVVRVSNCTATNNSAFGLYYSQGIMETRGNSTVRGNGTGQVRTGMTSISGQ